MGTMFRFLSNLWQDKRGNVVVIVGLCAGPLLLASLGVIEVTAMSSEKAKLQAAVDAGALAGAGRLAVATSNSGQGAMSAGISVAEDSAQRSGVKSTVKFDAVTGAGKDTLTVNATAQHKALIGLMGFGDAQISVSATAENMGSVPLCVLQTGSGGLKLMDQSRIRATGCAVHSNDNIPSQAAACCKQM